MGGKDSMKVTCVFTSTKTLTECQPLSGVVAGEVRLVLLWGTLFPGYCCHRLQSTNGHMHTVRTIDIGSHKQRAMYAYMH
jgi:hypothetical protein